MNKRSRRAIFSVLAGFTSVLLTGCMSGAWSSDTSHVVIGMSDDVLSTDPASGYDPGSWLMFNNVFQSLLSFPDGGTEPVPDAARACAFTDGRSKVFRCTLKDGLQFSNGDPLTSRDVKFSFDRTLRIDDAAGPAVILQSLEKIDTPDDKTVVFRLKTPDATFPSKIASGAGAIVDHREYHENGLRQDHEVIGSGPYKIDSFGTKEAVFSVNENYKGVAEVKNSGVVLKFFHGDRGALKAAVTDGKVDIAYRGLSAQDLTALDTKHTGDVDVVEGSSAEVQHLVFNMDDPVAGKLSVRRALAYLIDRGALVDKVFAGTAIPLYSIIPAGIDSHSNAFTDRYGDAPSRSKAAAALQEDGITEKVKLTLWSTPSRYGPATDEELKEIAAQLNASGLFDAEMRSVSFSRYEKDIAAGKYGVYVKGWLPDYPDPDNFTAPFFGPGNVLDNKFVNTAITRTLLPRAAAESDRHNATPLFDRLQEIVAEQLPVLPVWQGKQYAVVRTDVEGYQYCLDNSTVFRFWELFKG